MTDAELIARLRDEHVAASRNEAADRIEALIAERDEYHSEAMTYIEKWGAARKAQDEAEAKLAKAHKDGSQLAAWQCLFDDGKTGIVCDDWGNQYCAMQRRADRAEAALAAQIEADAEICTYIIQNYDCMKADKETYQPMWVQKVAKGMVSIARDDIRNQPHDRTALDRMLAETREKALREAAAICKADFDCKKLLGVGVEPLHEAILALIEEPNAR